MADEPDDLPAQRYLLLLRQMAAELNESDGYQEEMRARLGVSQATISHILTGKRRAGVDSINKAIQALSLDPNFFYSPDLGENPSYRSHVIPKTRLERERPVMPAIAAYFAKNPHHERFREEVIDTIHSSKGDVKPEIVKSVVRALEDAEEASVRPRS